MGLFGAISRFAGKAVGQIKGIATKAIPGGGLVSGAIGLGSKIAGRIGRKNMKAIAAGGLLAAGAGAGAVMRGGGGGVMTPGQAASMGMLGAGRRRRRINPGNPHAMRRAIRRVTAGAKMYHKLFGITHKNIHGAPGVHIRRGRRKAA